MMAKFSASLKSVAKVKNHRGARSAKVEIRRNVLEEIGAGKARVFDAFAGSGEMFREVWSDAAGYAGCDLEWIRDDRLAFVADNRRVLRAVDLSAFNVFDLDAYGSPYEQAIIIAARRPVAKGEAIGLVLTDGSGLKLKQGSLPKALAELAGMKGQTGKRAPAAGLGRLQEEVINQALAGLAARMGCTIERRWQAKGKTGAAVRYVGMVLKGSA